MFCQKCGNSIPEGVQYCPVCGAPTSTAAQMKDAANNMFNKVEQEMGSAINDVHQSFSGNANGGYNGAANGGYNGAPNAGYGKKRLKEDRGLVSYILLSIITCGIYGYYFLYQMASDVNIACEGDGDKTAGLAAFIILSFVTCGIYAWIWYYQLGNRLAANAPRYGLNFQENGTTVLLWQLFGSMLCGIGPFVAMHILIKNSNAICSAYNRQNGI